MEKENVIKLVDAVHALQLEVVKRDPDTSSISLFWFTNEFEQNTTKNWVGSLLEKYDPSKGMFISDENLNIIEDYVKNCQTTDTMTVESIEDSGDKVRVQKTEDGRYAVQVKVDKPKYLGMAALVLVKSDTEYKPLVVGYTIKGDEVDSIQSRSLIDEAIDLKRVVENEGYTLVDILNISTFDNERDHRSYESTLRETSSSFETIIARFHLLPKI